MGADRHAIPRQQQIGSRIEYFLKTAARDANRRIPSGLSFKITRHERRQAAVPCPSVLPYLPWLICGNCPQRGAYTLATPLSRESELFAAVRMTPRACLDYRALSASA